jgi:hypothetical protein
MRGPELVLISAVVGVALSLYVFFTGRHRERMSMIDKGVDANIFYSKKKNGISSTLKFGMLLVGVSVGILIGEMLNAVFSMNKGTSYVSMIFLFGGVSLIINFLIERKMDSGSENK